MASGVSLYIRCHERLYCHRAVYNVPLAGDGKMTMGDKEVYASVVVWSVGKNGIDEEGSGDDIWSFPAWADPTKPDLGRND